MSGGNDLILTLVFLGLAVFVIVKLRAVLGTRTGFERPPEVIRREMEERQRGTPPGQQPQDNVVSFPNQNGPNGTGIRPPPLPEQPELTQAERWKGIAEPGTPLANGLDAIVAADPAFDPREFVGGARQAYEMIVQAYARGDRKVLKTFLAKDVFDGFAAAIADRESRGETSETTFVSIDKADVIAAEMRDKFAHVTVSFGSKIITAVRDKTGAVVDGSAEKIVDVNDIWTFARDTTSRDPNWKLVATESNG
jgi:predicted lipid-binding transport protein (Tim44 family)